MASKLNSCFYDTESYQVNKSIELEKKIIEQTTIQLNQNTATIKACKARVEKFKIYQKQLALEKVHREQLEQTFTALENLRSTLWPHKEAVIYNMPIPIGPPLPSAPLPVDSAQQLTDLDRELLNGIIIEPIIPMATTSSLNTILSDFNETTAALQPADCTKPTTSKNRRKIAKEQINTLGLEIDTFSDDEDLDDMFSNIEKSAESASDGEKEEEPVINDPEVIVIKEDVKKVAKQPTQKRRKTTQEPNTTEKKDKKNRKN